MQIVLNRKTFIRNKIPLIFSKLKYFLSLSLLSNRYTNR